MKSIYALLALLYTTAAFALPTFNPQLILVNPQGEKTPYGVVYPGTTFIGGKIAANSVVSNITGSIAYPVANTYAAVSAKLTPAMLLTGFTAGAGTVAASDTVLQGMQKIVGNQALGLTPGTPQALAAAGAVSVSVMETTVTNAGSTYAITLAAPSGIDGQVKIIKAITAMSGTVTLAMTNIATPGFLVPTTGISGTTTLTFTNVGDCVILIAVGGKWQLIGGSAVAS